MTHHPFDPLAQRIQVSEYLAGSKVALQVGKGPIMVSPAMWDLLRHANPEELNRLLSAIKVLHLPDPLDPLPVTITIDPFNQSKT